MAIMWEPPKSASVRPSLAELAWRLWLATNIKKTRLERAIEGPRSEGDEATALPTASPGG